ncbi:chemotaxis protein CheW [Roseomonas sp. GC11]|uniref:chemotaxis protein CheW n=1 Tax=Roseomonas sp. GC11 TaxID=2950546 RepID=UPI00210EEF2C|nr:chemotaxis protein CheW [Roseomonas sp. GC11]MCQ4159452.1 chemotaxis protein CheW [Roseomonas sp. GC11]
MPNTEPPASLRVVTIDLQGERFALEARHVREILDPGPTTLVPNAPRFLNRLINVRGRVVPLADLRLKLGLEQRAATIDTRVIVIEVPLADEPVTVAVLADKVHEVRDIATLGSVHSPKFGLCCPSEYVRCIGRQGEDFVIVLDPVPIFAPAPTRRGDPHPDQSAAP